MSRSLELFFTTGSTRRVLFMAVLLSAVTGCSRLHSDLTVQANNRFILGGNQRGAFTVRASNKGSVPVTLSEKRTDGQLVILGLFSPGQAKTLHFAGGSAVLIDNASTKPARFDLTVSGDNGLNMKTTQNQ